jgi:hypothetical protein
MLLHCRVFLDWALWNGETGTFGEGRVDRIKETAYCRALED